MHIKDGETFCFYCEVIAQDDKRLADESKERFEKAKDEKIKTIFDQESLINPRLKSCTFANYEPKNPSQERAKQICERYANHFDLDNPVNLMLIGKYGIGKSHLSVSIIKNLIEKRYKCLFVSAPKLFTKITSTYNRNAEHTEDELFKALENVDCLVLDDVGAEQTKKNNEFSWAKRKFFEIVDSRIGKHTVYTTNYSHDQLLEIYRERNYSRMLEGTTPFEMHGTNFRLEKFKGADGK